MAERVFLHIGLPKTGTTFLQTTMWHNRAQLEAQGFLYPGAKRMDHYHASQDVRGQRTPPTGAWEQLRSELAKVLPGKNLTPIPPTHEWWRCSDRSTRTPDFPSARGGRSAVAQVHEDAVVAVVLGLADNLAKTSPSRAEQHYQAAAEILNRLASGMRKYSDF